MTIDEIKGKYGLQQIDADDFRSVETSGLLLEKEMNRAFGRIQKMASDVISKSDGVDRKSLDSKAQLLLQRYRRDAESALRMIQMFKK